MKIINLTPHALHIRRADGTDIEIQPSGIVPRLEVTRAECDSVTCEDGAEIAVSRATFGTLTGMPPVSRSCTACSITEGEARDGSQPRNMACEDGFAHQFVTDAIFVVSALCAQSPELAGRNDVYAPGEALRDASGKIIGSQGLSYIVPISPVRDAQGRIIACGALGRSVDTGTIIAMVNKLAGDVASETPWYEQGFLDIISAIKGL